ncbi:uncharacterized protein PGTG_02981 [Puccinia graminis f. sp. tritici CRL 75-36-700-3]|uniref:Uncharacterized protein n=1 Tax=Puccinia graminis f. sp. tritici (strain CRL 75-36-700-3 / race SCCL) TaxID=418459 RepID=E3JWW5_PUCGT|nr:uncharacterized protein PGTG_02981 [Puccinia graminis f. sp. tritici CRL 75-36-700-3]EFP76540.1 hypothetical protein PGTG_02981 [Puccinia graminis f. sp. tritici CRL 75-36-700-3]
MTRILERLAFWRKKQPRSELNNRNQPSSSRPLPPIQPTALSTPLENQTSFLVPDLDDIRPFVTSTSNPISMRDLLNAISASNHQPAIQQIPSTEACSADQLNVQLKYNQLSIRSKRKRDEADQQSNQSIESNQFNSFSSYNSHNQPGTICRATHIAITSSDTPPQFKKPKLVTISSSEDLEQLHNQLDCSQPPPPPPSSSSSSSRQHQIRRSSAPQPILGLPSHIWYQIFLYNQLDTIQALIPEHPSSSSSSSSNKASTLQSTNSIRSPKALSTHLKLALEAQQNRHALIGLCKTLSPIARKAAWSTLLLGTAKMVDQIAQRFEADSHLANQVQTCIITLLPPPRGRTGPQFDSPRRSTPGATENVSSKPSPLTPKQPGRSSHPSVRKIQNQPTQNRTPPTSRQSLPLARQALISSRSGQKCERFHSVLIPSLPPDKKVTTSRNTKLNSLSPLDDPQQPRRARTEADGVGEGPESEAYLDEIVLAGSLPSLFLSLARSMKLCCLIGEERLGTRGLKSLSVLSGLLGGLEELYVEGGGQFHDLVTLVDGLRSSTIRGKGAALRTVSVTGPHSTLSRIPSHSSTAESARSTLTCPLSQSSTSSNKPTQSHLSLEHLVLGNGIPLTPERLHWLVVSATGSPRGLRSLRVCLQADMDQPSLSSSVSSSSSSGSGRRMLSGRALLSRTFERVGGSLEWLALDEDWNAPLTGRLTRKVSFAGQPGEGILEEPVAFCSRLTVLSLPDGPLCSTGLLSVLPFTLQTIEIFDSGAPSNDDLSHSSSFSAHELWLAHSQAALFGLKTVQIVADSSTHSLFRKWKRAPSDALDHLIRAGVQFRWISAPSSS